jgi:hypothetical protein
VVNIKLLICYHKPGSLFKDEILTPIHGGRANAVKMLSENDENTKWMLENMIGDDTGDNISHKNSSYNEMTSIYWAWKNYAELGNPEYIGFMHYRRHFVYKEGEIKVYPINDFNIDYYFEEINYSIDTVRQIVSGCDFIAHIGRVNNVYNHFIENHRKEDLDTVVEIMLEKYPKYENVTKEYFEGNESNFCNMFIISRDLFFEYCEWMFSILEEFERKVDLSEKRLFVTERLSGIFIADLINSKRYKHKILPTSFIEEPITIPIVLKYAKETAFHSALTVKSILKNRKREDEYSFYFLYDTSIDNTYIEKMKCLVNEYSKATSNFQEYNGDEEDIPAYLPELLTSEVKVLYITGVCLAMHDIGEFMRICSVDDYLIVGTPLGDYLPKEKVKKLGIGITLINCKRMRSHHIRETYKKDSLTSKGFTALNKICEGEIGYIPWNFFTSERTLKNCEKVLNHDNSRIHIQRMATWRAWLIYDCSHPWENSQGVYSIFWWEYVRGVAKYFNFVQFSEIVIESFYGKQQKEINEYSNCEPIENSQHQEIEKPIENSRHQEIENPIEDSQHQEIEKPEVWRSYSLYRRYRIFREHNSFMATITYSAKKLISNLGGNLK